MGLKNVQTMHSERRSSAPKSRERRERVTKYGDRPRVGRAMSRFIAAVIVFSAGVAGVLAQAPPLTLVSTVWAPFTNEPGQPRFALDLVEAALGRIKRFAKTTIVPPAQFTTSLISGKFDGS